MATPQPTPEEKLFAVIQSGGQQTSWRRPSHPRSMAGLGAYLLTRIGPLTLPRVNDGLIVIIGLLGMACLVNLFLWPHIDRLEAQATQHMMPFVIAPPLEGLKDATEYAQLIRTNDPFRVGETSVALPSSTTEPTPTGPNPREALADFKMVGIAWGDEPTAMIEQVSTHQTHFLKVGSPIGPFTVKEILQDRVVLQVGEQTLELF